MNLCKKCGKEIKQGSICTTCLQNLGFSLPEGIELDEEEYKTLYKSHNLCQKISEFNCEECEDLEQCKTKFPLSMLDFQRILKAKGKIRPNLEIWMEKTYHELRKEYIELPEYDQFLKQPPFFTLKDEIELIEHRRRKNKKKRELGL